MFAQVSDGPSDFFSGAFSLYANRTNEQAKPWAPPLQDIQHILYRSASGRSNKSDASRKWWKGFLMGRIKQTFGFQLALKSLELCLQQPDTLGQHQLNNQLALTPPLINADPSDGADWNSVPQSRPRVRGSHHR